MKTVVAEEEKGLNNARFILKVLYSSNTLNIAMHRYINELIIGTFYVPMFSVLKGKSHILKGMQNAKNHPMVLMLDGAQKQKPV